ncbi:MAG: phosphomannomutase/phosphoglucomutase [Candidatus Peribacteraceae bacterium]
MIDPRIFRAYDIRGVAHTQITVDACTKIGQAFGAELKKRYSIPHPTVVVGRDARTHGPELMQACIDGLVRAGARVLDIGITMSPINYFTIADATFDGGMQITASHNPKEDNGIKLQTRGAEAFSGENLQRLREGIESEKWLVASDTLGSVEPYDAVTPYIARLTSMFAGIGKGMKIAVDAGNGAAGPVSVRILREIGCEVTELYTEPDGTFPNHAADPSKYSTLQELQAVVKQKKLHVGLAFDGDGDRLGAVDQNGQIVTADQLLLLFAEDHLRRIPGATIVYTVSNSSLLETEVKKWGGRPVMCKVGHSFVEHTMHEHHALLGGEQSGHFFLGEDYFSFDDAMVAALRLLSIVQQSGSSLSALISSFPAVYQMQEKRPACPDDAKASVVERATKHFQAMYPVATLDGARIDFGDGAWAGIRYSNTSPCLSICIEARSEERLKQVEAEVLEHMRTYGEVKW